MDRRERFNNLPTALIAVLEGFASELWTALPCIVTSFNADKQTCEVQSAVQVRVLNPDGSTTWTKLPPLVDIPVVFPSGGGFTLTFPISPNDEVLVIFSTVCIDSWWQSGGKDNLLPDFRLHDLSDGFALPSPRSTPKKLAAFSETTAQLRSDDGATIIEVGAGVINMRAASVKIEATDSLELKCNHGVVWTPNAVDAYQNGIVTNNHPPPAP